MAETFKLLYQNQVPATATTLYTVPSATSTLVKTMRIVNTSASAATIKIWQNGTANANTILPTTSIDAGGFAEFEGTFTLGAADYISAQAGTASAITITIWGVELT